MSDAGSSARKVDWHDDVSDTSLPPGLELKDKPSLLKWRFHEGGHRLPQYAAKIPHVEEGAVSNKILREEAEVYALCEKLARQTRQARTEFIYTKQQADLLQQEKELLKWHLANDTKALSMKKSEFEAGDHKSKFLMKQLRERTYENDVDEETIQRLEASNAKLKERLDKVGDQLDEKQNDMEEWLGHRNDFINDTASERRQASHERSLRLRQWRKLDRACNADRKLHSKMDAIRGWDRIVFDTSRNAEKYMERQYRHLGTVIPKLRQRVEEEPQLTAEEILADFEEVLEEQILKRERGYYEEQTASETTTERTEEDG